MGLNEQEQAPCNIKLQKKNWDQGWERADKIGQPDMAQG